MEIWKDIKGYENKYQVSNLGNVRSLNYRCTGKPKSLKIFINRGRDKAEVVLSKNSKTKHFAVARLVAEAFIPNEENKEMVVHKNKNILDNSVENLEWASRKKYDKEDLLYKGKRYKTFKELAKEYGIDYIVFSKRLSRGWGVDLALRVPVSMGNRCGKPKFYEYYGRMVSSDEICKINNIDKRNFAKRLSRGWNIYEASEISVGRRSV